MLEVISAWKGDPEPLVRLEESRESHRGMGAGSTLDVDVDTQGDEGTETNGEVLLTRFEGDDEGDDAVHGDEVELDLEDALTTGRTVTAAPESD